MAHEVEKMFSVGEVPWHGLGVILRNPPSIEEAIRMAGLDWEVALKPLCIAEDGRPVRANATVRLSDGKILGNALGPDYRVLQNRDAFRWFQPFIDAGTATLESAGSLRGGVRVWVLAKIEGSMFDVRPGDAVQPYILLAHAHDHSLAIRVGFTAVRVVCMNTLMGAIQSESTNKLIKIRHTENAGAALEKIRTTMDLARQEFAATAEQLRELARVGCSDLTLRRYVRKVFFPAMEATDFEAGGGKGDRILAQVIPLFECGRGADLSRGTLWGAFNAVTEFTTHIRGRSADGRVDSQWFGEGAKIAQRALGTALEFAKAA